MDVEINIILIKKFVLFLQRVSRFKGLQWKSGIRCQFGTGNVKFNLTYKTRNTL